MEEVLRGEEWIGFKHIFRFDIYSLYFSHRVLLD